MSISVQTASARIAIASGWARPDVHIGPERVTCHLTRGFNQGSPDGVAQYAFDATGSVDITKGPNDSLSPWDFGFIQIARAKDVSFYYAGKSHNQGSIIIHAHLPPALANSLILDTDTTITPWTRGLPRYTYTSPSIKSPTGDHPAVRAGRQLQNRKTNTANYLYHIVTVLEFWTVFSYALFTNQEARQRYEHLRHFPWQVRYDVMFAWTAGEPRRVRTSSRFVMGEDVKGPPSDQSVLQLLNHPVTYKSFNTMLREAISRSIMIAPESNRSDQTERFITVPSDFWTD